MARMNNKGHYFSTSLYDHKKSVPSFDGTPESMNETEGSEGDFGFNIVDACIKGCPEKVNNFLDSRGEAGGEDVSV